MQSPASCDLDKSVWIHNTADTLGTEIGVVSERVPPADVEQGGTNLRTVILNLK